MGVNKQSEGWMSLGEAATLLGVHPSTVRNWSDAGVLPVHRTKGGHRRYARGELDLWLQAQRAGGKADLDELMQSALRNTRFHISEGRLCSEAWYSKLDDEARQQYRQSGRNLLRGLMAELATDGGQGYIEAESLGYEYASRGNRYGLSCVEATHALLFFRRVLLESMLAVFESAAVKSPHAWSAMLRKVCDFTDRILVTLLETYEAYQRAPRRSV